MDNFNLIDLDKVLDEFEKTEEDSVQPPDVFPSAPAASAAAASTWPRGAERRSSPPASRAVPVTSPSSSRLDAPGTAVIRPSSLKVQAPASHLGHQRAAACVSNCELHLPDDQASVSSSGYDSLRTSSEFIVSSQEHVPGSVLSAASTATLASCALPEEVTPTVEREDTFDSFRTVMTAAPEPACESQRLEEEVEEEVELIFATAAAKTDQAPAEPKIPVHHTPEEPKLPAHQSQEANIPVQTPEEPNIPVQTPEPKIPVHHTPEEPKLPTHHSPEEPNIPVHQSLEPNIPVHSPEESNFPVHHSPEESNFPVHHSPERNVPAPADPKIALPHEVPGEYQSQLPAVALDNCALQPDLVHAAAPPSVDLVPSQGAESTIAVAPVASFAAAAEAVMEMDEAEMNAYLGLETREEPEGTEETLPDIAASCGSLAPFAPAGDTLGDKTAEAASSEAASVSPPDIVDLEHALGQPDLLRPEVPCELGGPSPGEDFPCALGHALAPAVVDFAPLEISRPAARPVSLFVSEPSRDHSPGALSPGAAEKRHSLLEAGPPPGPTDVPKKRVRPNTLFGLTRPTPPSEALRQDTDRERKSPNENPLYLMDRAARVPADSETAESRPQEPAEEAPKLRRPTWLALPTRSISTDSGGGTTSSTLTPGPPGSRVSPMSEGTVTPSLPDPSPEAPEVEPTEEMDTNPPDSPSPSHPRSLHETVSSEHSLPPPSPVPSAVPTGPEPTPFSHDLGRVAPIWVHDRDAPACMGCATRFTLTRRRHHCRACGKVYCNACCGQKAKMTFLDGKEARVCAVCFQHLIRLESVAHRGDPTPSSGASAPLGDEVPTSALRGSRRRSVGGRTVVFADGIRPGGDLSESDSSARVTTPSRASAPPGIADFPVPARPSFEEEEFCFLNGLAADAVLPLVTSVCPELQLEVEPDVVEVASRFSLPEAGDEAGPDSALRFALTRHLHVMTSRVRLSCCVGMESWVVSTRGLAAYGQPEILIVLQTLPDELLPPLDLFRYLYGLYQAVKKGETFGELSCFLFETPFLGDKENAGFVFIRPTFQCLEQISLPPSQFLVGLLIQRWEAPLAKLFPLRLILRLGHFYRYYPCPIFSCRDRGPVYEMPGITLLQLLVDFRNFSYTIPAIPGLRVHLSPGGVTRVILHKASYSAVMRAISGIDSNVLALGAIFSTEADSHLVCVQSDVEEGSYTTQAISVHNRFRQVTGASFIILNGGMRQSKSSIVEDGVMVHLTAPQMSECLTALKAMRACTVFCQRCSTETGETESPNEEVHFEWTDESMPPGLALVSPRPVSWIDGLALDEPGISEYRAPVGLRVCGTGPAAHRLLWARLFLLRLPCPSDAGDPNEPPDPLQFGREVAAGVGKALQSHLAAVFAHGEAARSLALRVSLSADALVDFDLACRTADLTAFVRAECGPDLDAELVPLLISRSASAGPSPIVVELEFHVVE